MATCRRTTKKTKTLKNAGVLTSRKNKKSVLKKRSAQKHVFSYYRSIGKANKITRPAPSLVGRIFVNLQNRFLSLRQIFSRIEICVFDKVEKFFSRCSESIKFRRWFFRVTAVVIILLIAGSFVQWQLILAATQQITLQADWELGSYNDQRIDTKTSADSIQLRQGIGQWDQPANPPFYYLSYGATLASDGSSIYAFRGYFSPEFYRFDPDTEIWKRLADIPSATYDGADLVYGGDGYMYAFPGGNAGQTAGSLKQFWRYDIANDTWEAITDAPEEERRGTSLAYDGNGNIWALFSTSGADNWFYVYDISAGTWTAKSNMTVVPSSGGGGLVFVPAGASGCGSDDGCLYGVRGGNQDDFYQYDIQNNNWTPTCATAGCLDLITENVSYGNSIVYDSSHNDIYIFQGNQTDEFYQYDVATNKWDANSGVTENAPGNVYYGGAMAYLDGYIYGFPGQVRQNFWKFDVGDGTNGTWLTLDEYDDASHYSGTNEGKTLIYGATNTVYGYPGRNDYNFYEYDSSAGSWTTGGNFYSNNGPQRGSNLAYDDDNNLVYIVVGENGINFYEYNGTSWSQEDDLPEAAQYGSASAYITGDGVYALRGNNQRDIWRFTTPDGPWTADSVLEDVPEAVYMGGAMASDDIYLYVFTGNYSNSFYQYDPDGDADGVWTQLADVPAPTYYGADMTFVPNGAYCADAGGCIYAFTGNYKPDFWRYNISGGDWEKMANAPHWIGGGGSVTYNPDDDKIYAVGGYYGTSLWTYTIEDDNTHYVTEGTYVSKSIDLIYAADFTGGFSATTNIPANTSITWYSRTSADQATWSDWEEIVAGAIASDAARYIKIKAVLETSDTAFTPRIDDFTITYTGDVADPTNPAGTATGLSDTGGTSITSGQSYSYNNPFFSWSAGTDAASGVVGYYVHWSTGTTFDETSVGTYQTGTNYQVNTGMSTGIYHLLIKTKDIAGNVADTAWDAFTYIYSGISPANEFGTPIGQAGMEVEEAWTCADCTNTNLDTGDSSNIRLSGVTAGFWEGTSPLPAYGQIGDTMTTDGTYLYALRGNTRDLYRYTPSTDTWDNDLDAMPGSTNTQYGANLEYVNNSDGEFLYATPGRNTTWFYRFDLTAEEWQQYDQDISIWTASAGNPLPLPDEAYFGTQLEYVPFDDNDDIDRCNDAKGCLFILEANNSTEFWRFDLTDNAFNTSQPIIPNNARMGATMEYVSDNGYMYALRGNNAPYLFKHDFETGNWTYENAAPSNVYYGATMTYDGDSTLYVINGSVLDTRTGQDLWWQRQFWSCDINTGYWTVIGDAPIQHYQGEGNNLVYLDGYLYFLGNTYFGSGLYKYDIANSRWISKGLPNNSYYSNIVFDGDDNLYATAAYNDIDFYKYSISNESWSRLANTPTRTEEGSDLIFIPGSHADCDNQDGCVFLTRGNGTDDFWKYNIDYDSWEVMDPFPETITQGGGLAWGQDGYIYGIRGQNDADFYRYDIDSGATGSWGDAPEDLPAAVDDGSSIAYVPASETGCPDSTGCLFIIRGNNTSNVYRFDINDGAFETVTPPAVTPNATEHAETLFYDEDGGLWTFDVNTTQDFWKFDLTSTSPGSWDDTVAEALGTPYYADIAKGDPTYNIMYALQGGQYNETMWKYVAYESDTTSFEESGSHTSSILDLGNVGGWGGLTAVFTENTNTTITVDTRSCSDSDCDPVSGNGDASAEWDAWDEVSQEKTNDYDNTHLYDIDSTAAQYLQIRLSWSSADKVFSPVVNSMQVSYYVDNTDPDNPSTTSAYTDDTPGDPLSASTWYNDATPYFDWDNASDNVGGSGVAGYYVYFGSDNTKDPIDDAGDATNLAYVGGTNLYTASEWDALDEAASALTTDTYYLRIRTEDNVGNQADATYAAFIYQYDGTNPTQPGSLDVTPTGYSATDNFDFDWNASTDTDSNIVSYCYKTATTNPLDPFYTEQCTTDLFINDVTSYQSRSNTFYVRALDNAGNYSGYSQTNFYYAGDAPTAPAALYANPTSAVDNNTFSFSWELPATCLGQTPCAAGDVLRYCYTINEVPSAATCGQNTSGSDTPSPDGGWTTSTQTSNKLLPGFSAATQQGTNTLYLVATDSISNIDYDNYVTVTYDFISNAPGPPTSMQAVDSSDRSTSRYLVTLTWDEPTDEGSGVEGYKVYRCEDSVDCTNPSTVDDPPDNYSMLAEVDADNLGYLNTSLDNTITYSYFTRAIGSGGTISGNSAVVDIKPEGKFKNAPSISGLPLATARIRSAVIEWLTLDDQDREGNIIPHPATSFVEYGETTAYGGETGTSELVSEHEVTVTDLTPDTEYHYRTKWVDQDGNVGYSSDFQFTTKGAPSAPLNLAVTPASNTLNNFAFNWEAPDDEGVTVAGYYYVVNNLPNEENVTYMEETSLTAYDAATQQGINTFYVVAIDNTGNINYSNYAAIEFEAYTTPPGSPHAVTITDSSDRDAKRYSITITWDPPEGYTLEDEIYYTIERSIDGLTFEEIATITSTGYLDTGLNNSTEYYYKITAEDKAQATSLPTDVVSEVPEGRYTSPPAITEAPVAVPDSFSALVNWRTERIASSFVDFGITKTDWTEEQGTADLLEQHEVKVTGLKSETTYYYQIKSIDVDENEAYSDVKSFTTLEAPRVMDVKITDVRLYDGIISWETNKESTAAIQYGTTANYGFTWTDTTLSYAYTHTVKLENLSDSTLYHLRIGGQDKNGNPISSDDYTFSTLTFPKVSDITYENKAEGQTEVYWKTNVPTTSEVEYYSENISPKTQGNTAMVTDHVILLYGLEDAARYLFKVRGSDAFGYEAVSEENEFTTLEDTTPPEIFGIQSESNTIGSGEGSKIQIVISWKSDEPTTSQVEFGVGLSGSEYSDQTEENAELVMDHLTVISELAPAKTYHFRVVSRDKAGNETKSGSHSVLTSRKRESFLQLIITNLEQTFSWLGNMGSLF
ncbi:hypothetical protein KKC06_05820 [Patescibacteria group bacterium]|nr:hypothetical protein [Patescibacteria group bacterium]